MKILVNMKFKSFSEIFSQSLWGLTGFAASKASNATCRDVRDLGRVQVGAEYALDPPEPFVERRPGQVRSLAASALFPPHEVRASTRAAMCRSAVEQRAQLALHDVASAGRPGAVHQAAQAQVSSR